MSSEVNMWFSIFSMFRNFIALLSIVSISSSCFESKSNIDNIPKSITEENFSEQSARERIEAESRIILEYLESNPEVAESEGVVVIGGQGGEIESGLNTVFAPQGAFNEPVVFSVQPLVSGNFALSGSEALSQGVVISTKYLDGTLVPDEELNFALTVNLVINSNLNLKLKFKKSATDLYEEVGANDFVVEEVLSGIYKISVEVPFANVTISAFADPLNTSSGSGSSNESEQSVIDVSANDAVSIASQTAATSSDLVDLTFNVENASEMYITYTEDCSSGGQWESYSSIKSDWQLATLNGSNTIYIKFRDASGVESACVSQTIVHDDIRPASPVITSPTPASGGQNGAFSFDVDFSGTEPATLTESDVTPVYTGSATCAGLTISSLSETMSRVKLTGCTGQGTVGISVSGAVLTDLAGNTAVDTVSALGTIEASPLITLSAAELVIGQIGSSKDFLRVDFESSVAGNWEVRFASSVIETGYALADTPSDFLVQSTELGSAIGDYELEFVILDVEGGSVASQKFTIKMIEITDVEFIGVTIATSPTQTTAAPAHLPGDLLIVISNVHNAAFPALSGFRTLFTQWDGYGTTRVQFKIADSNSFTLNPWANSNWPADQAGIYVYRNATIGAYAMEVGTTYPSIDFLGNYGPNWVMRILSKGSSTGGATTPSGYTTRHQMYSNTVYDSNGPLATADVLASGYSNLHHNTIEIRPRDISEDADGTMWMDLVESREGRAFEPEIRNALNTFFASLKTEGHWDNINYLWIPALTTSVENAFIPMKGSAPGNTSNYLIPTYEGYDRARGLKSNGADFINLNFLNTEANLPRNDNHILTYVTKRPSSPGVILGSGGGSPSPRTGFYTSASDLLVYNKSENPGTMIGSYVGNGTLASVRNSASAFGFYADSSLNAASSASEASNVTSDANSFLLFDDPVSSALSDARVFAVSMGKYLVLGSYAAALDALYATVHAAVKKPIPAVYSQSSLASGMEAATAENMTNGFINEGLATVTEAFDAGGGYVQMDFGLKRDFNSVVIGSVTSALNGSWDKSNSENRVIQGSNDGTDWVTISNTGLFDDDGSIKEILTPGQSFRFLRVGGHGTSGSFGITEFYCRE